MTLIYGLPNLNFYYEQYEFDEQSESYLKCVQFIEGIYHTSVQMDFFFRLIEMSDEDANAF